MEDGSEGLWLGLDFGTCHCAAAVWDENRQGVKWLRCDLALTDKKNDEKLGRLVPTVSSTSSTTVGQPALGENVEVLRHFKSWLTESASPESLNHPPYNKYKHRIISSSSESVTEEKVQFYMRGKWMFPSQIFVDFMQAWKNSLERQLQSEKSKKKLSPLGSDAGNYSIQNIVMGIPAHMTQKRRDWIVALLQQVFHGHVSTIIESTAAALSYGFFITPSNDNDQKQKHIFVLDIGGGTTDVTIVTMTQPQLTVLATKGHSNLGGNEMDQAIYDHLVQQFPTITLFDCCQLKEQLCQSHLDSITYSNKTSTLTLSLSKEELQQVLQPFHETLKYFIETLMEDLNLSSHDIQEVIFVGGASQTPTLEPFLKSSLFPNISQFCTAIPPSSAVAQGAAIQAAIKSQLVPYHHIQSVCMLDCLPHSIGIQLPNDNFVEILPKYSTLPSNGYSTFTLASSAQPGITLNVVERIQSHGNVSFFEPIKTFTFLLHRITQKKASIRSVDVGMTMETNGKLIVSIYDPLDPEHVQKRNHYLRNKLKQNNESNCEEIKLPESEPIPVVLIMTCFILFVSYIAARLSFTEINNQ